MEHFEHVIFKDKNMSAQHWEARQRQRALEYREEKRRAAIAATEGDAVADSGLIFQILSKSIMGPKM